MRLNHLLAAVVVGVCGAVAMAQETAKPEEKPKDPPVKVDVTRKDQIEAAVDKDVVFAGRVESAQWSSTGRMMIVRFAGTPENFRATAYQKQREALDKGFEGDFAKGIEGKDVEVTGRVRRYKGTNEAWKEVIEVPITKPSQVKVVEKK